MTPSVSFMFKCAEAFFGTLVVVFPALHWLGF